MDDLIDRDDDPQVGRSLGLSRRQLLAATTGVAAAAALGSAAMGGVRRMLRLAPRWGGGGSGVLVPPGKRGIILYTVRDAISRDPNTTDLPSGFLEVSRSCSGSATSRSSSPGSTSTPTRPAEREQRRRRTAAAHLARRQWPRGRGQPRLDPVTITDATLAAFDAPCEIANILGFGHIGTGNDPTGTTYVADWQAAAERWNILGERAATHGLKLYTHNHDAAYNFLLDSGPPDALGRPTRSSGTRRLEHFLANTDPNYVYLEMDIYWAHVAQYRWHTYTAPDGTAVDDLFDPAATSQRRPPGSRCSTPRTAASTPRSQRLRHGPVQ